MQYVEDVFNKYDDDASGELSYDGMVSLIFRLSVIISIFYHQDLKKQGGFEKLLGFSRSHLIATRGSASLSCATTPFQLFFILTVRPQIWK